MAPRRPPSDTVWRQAVTAEHQGNSGGFSLQVLWDIKQFYEPVTYDILVRSAQYCKYPLFLLQFAIGTYQWPRHLMLEGLMDAA
eukprot:7791806-Pyramimonas_sp.AAC.1